MNNTDTPQDPIKLARELRQAAASVVEWFDEQAPEISGPRIFRLRTALAALDAIPQPAPVPDDPRVQGYERAYQYALNLADSLHAKHYSDNPRWRPLGDLLGLLTQIDNMAAGITAAAICERCAAIRAEALSDMAATDAKHGMLNEPALARIWGGYLIPGGSDVPAPVPADAELDALQAWANGQSCIARQGKGLIVDGGKILMVAVALSALRTRLAEVEGVMDRLAGAGALAGLQLERMGADGLSSGLIDALAAHRKLKEGK